MSQHLGHASVKATEIDLTDIAAGEKVAVMKELAQIPTHEQRSGKEPEEAST